MARVMVFVVDDKQGAGDWDTCESLVESAGHLACVVGVAETEAEPDVAEPSELAGKVTEVVDRALRDDATLGLKPTEEG